MKSDSFRLFREILRAKENGITCNLCPKKNTKESGALRLDACVCECVLACVSESVRCDLFKLNWIFLGQGKYDEYQTVYNSGTSGASSFHITSSPSLTFRDWSSAVCFETTKYGRIFNALH